MEGEEMNVKRLSERDLARELQLHFRRHVKAVKLMRDEISGEPVVYVEFVAQAPAQEARQ
jgi:hypothetical protein